MIHAMKAVTKDTVGGIKFDLFDKQGWAPGLFVGREFFYPRLRAA